MATLDDVLNAVRQKTDFLDLVEVTDNTRTGSKLKQYEVYFGKPDVNSITVEYLQIYVNGNAARIVSPCFMCGKASTFKTTIQSALDQMKQGADKVRVLLVDDDEKYALVEKTVYNQSTGKASIELYRLYELPDRSIRVVES